LDRQAKENIQTLFESLSKSAVVAALWRRSPKGGELIGGNIV